MAGNKFATMLNKNTHKLTVILIYALLEWILIILLLLNSFFTYLITKFANYFGLKPPCPWCSRVDHVLEPGNSNATNRDLLCEKHAAEVSRLGYCSSHRRLAETQNMCLDCLASRPNDCTDDYSESIRMTRRIAFFSWVRCGENGENVKCCSCCNESLNENSYPSPYLLFKPSWKNLEYTQKGNLVIEAVDDDDINGRSDQCKLLLGKGDCLGDYIADSNEIERNIDGEELQMLYSDIGSFGLKDSIEEEECSGSESNDEEKEGNEDQKAEQDCYGMNFIHESFDEEIIQPCHCEDSSVEVINLQFQRNFECEFTRVIPVELIDSSTSANHGSFISKEDLIKLDDHEDESDESAVDSSLKIKIPVNVSENGEKEENLEIKMDDGGDKTSALNEEIIKDFVEQVCEQIISLQVAQCLPSAVDNDTADTREKDELEEKAAHEEEINDCKLSVDQIESELLIELSTYATNESQEQESTPPVKCLQEDNSCTDGNHTGIPNAPGTCMDSNELGSDCKEKSSMEESSNSADKNHEAVSQHSPMHSESIEAEEEKFPETPTSVDSFNYLHKKSFLFERRESGAEESLDGSVLSEIDGGDPVLTVEKLKTALKDKRNALNALYSELEEERSASAVAANQTMAMINRLQEEKAAMQMEALQYQRMMEEQSEYDQEALQLLNELMVKREREKQELEKEWEVYRKKVSDYEAREKIRLLRRSKDGSVRSRNSSASFSNAEDIDALSIDLNREAREEDDSIYENQDHIDTTTGDENINLEEIALDCVKQISSLDDSFAEYEEERLSILDQLKALEERLIALHEKEVNDEDRNSVESSSKYSEKGFDESYGLSTPEENGISHGLSNDKHYIERKTMGSMAKSLLPLLDAADNETEEGLTFEENVASEFVEMENPSVSNFVLDSKKLALEEEVDHVYERLQALEADREFLKHCMSSIKNGDKGMDLLQEILQHLRDLRAVELRTRNMNDDYLG